MKTLRSSFNTFNKGPVVHHHDQFSSDYSNEHAPVSGFELLERLKQMQMSTGKELNHYDSSIQIQSLNSRLAEDLMKRQNPDKFYKSGWSQMYEQRFGKQETGKFFRHPEAVLRKESLYSIPARHHAIETQFRITKDALDTRQKDNELLYLGTAEQKALQSIVEKQLSKEAGGFLSIAEWMKTGFTSKDGRTRRRNERLAKKITEEMNLPAAKSADIVAAMTGHMADKSDEVTCIEASAAAQSGMTIDDFRQTNRGKKLVAELVHTLVVGGFMAAGIATGALAPIAAVAAIPLLGLNFKGRVPMGLNGDVITDNLREGRNLTETIEHTARELDSTLHMTQNLINSSELLSRGRNVRYLRGVDKRYSNLKQVIDHKQMEFDMASLGDQSLETKSMYETLGFVVDAQGQIQLAEAKKFKKMLYSWGERNFSDRKDTKDYKASIKVLKDSVPSNATLQDVISLNQRKVLELENIIALSESELAEESTKRRNRKNPARLENKRSMLRQLKRFAKTQRYFVNDQKTFHLLKDLGEIENPSLEQKKKGLYEAAVITFLGSFDSAEQVMNQFGGRMPFMHPDGRNFTPDWDCIQTTLEAYYRSPNPKPILQDMIGSTDFETWMMSVGSFTNIFGSHKNLPSMERMSCQANAIDQRKVCDYKDYNFESDFVVSPKGTKFYLPLGIPLGMVEQTAAQLGIGAGKNAVVNEAAARVPQAVLDAIAAANAPKPFMASFWAPTGIPTAYTPNIVGTISGGIASTAIQHRNRPKRLS